MAPLSPDRFAELFACMRPADTVEKITVIALGVFGVLSGGFKDTGKLQDV